MKNICECSQVFVLKYCCCCCCETPPSVDSEIMKLIGSCLKEELFERKTWARQGRHRQTHTHRLIKRNMVVLKCKSAHSHSHSSHSLRVSSCRKSLAGQRSRKTFSLAHQNEFSYEILCKFKMTSFFARCLALHLRTYIVTYI